MQQLCSDIITIQNANSIIRDYDVVIIDCNISKHFHFKQTKLIKVSTKNKNWKRVFKIHKKLYQLEVTKKTKVLLIGGGSLTDLAGFALSLYKRGIPYDSMPSTLLAMVDASIGGKVGIDTKYGKNQIGSFFAPQKVFIYTPLLSSLNKKEFKNGMGEVIKYSLLDSHLHSNFKKLSLSELITTCAKIKIEYVKKDPFDNEERRFLNLGHTFGHCFESILKIPHGLAVLKGIEAVLSINNSKLLPIFQELLLFHKIQVPKLTKKISFKQFWSLLKQDKKREGDFFNLVILEDIGKPKIQKFKIKDLKNILKDHPYFQEIFHYES